jgi:RNA polymerase sigma factor (sigma-70 family)
VGEIAPCAPSKGAQELLVEFQQTGQQAPFEEIARRYAGMVYNVALQVTRDAHDAEDATQATFLTLAVHARTAGKIRFVGPWLRKVSHRLALDIRRSKKRRNAREEKHTRSNGNGHEPPAFNGMQMEELRQILREELDKLPAKYRLPLILYYFGGLSPVDMGKELNCNTSTLGVRLHRGRKMLADNLADRGITMPMAVMIGLLSGLVDTFVKDNLVHSASHGAAQIAANGFIAHGAVSTNVLGLMNCASSAIAWSRPKAIIATVLLLLSTLTGAAGVLNHFNVLSLKNFPQLDISNLLRPLLNHLRSGPSFSAASPLPDSVINADAPLALNVDLSLSPSWPVSSEFSDSTSHDQRILGSTTTVVSGHAMAFGVNDLKLNLVAPPISIKSAPVATAVPESIVTTPKTIPPALNFASATASPLPTPSPVIANPSDTIIVDRAAPSAGTFAANSSDAGDMSITSGTLRADKLIVGDRTSGSVTQTGGTVQITKQVVIANQTGSTGSYKIGGSGKLSSPAVTVANAGTGTLQQTGGEVVVTTPDHSGQLALGAQAGSNGEYLLSGGTLYADHVVVGQNGTGALTQTGGLAEVTSIQIGQGSTGSGLLSVSGGTLNLSGSFSTDLSTMDSAAASPAPPPTPIVIVGGDGSGTVLLHPTDGGTITENDATPGGTLVVRSTEIGNGAFRGWGNVQLTGPMIQNGRIVADGFGQSHALDFSSAAFISNTIENPTTGGTNGWFARNGGSIILPSIKVTGETAYNWGDDQYDSTIDLVNSVTFTPHGLTAPGLVSIKLLDPQSTDAPPLPSHAIGLWELDSTTTFSSMDLTVRYDDALAADLQMSQSDLRLWIYENGWQMISGDSLTIDLDNKLLTGVVDGMPTFFAAAPAEINLIQTPVPEPAVFALITVSTSVLMLRRRRK